MSGHHFQVGEVHALVQRAPGVVYSNDGQEVHPWMMRIFWWACGAHETWGTAATPSDRDEQIRRHTEVA